MKYRRDLYNREWFLNDPRLTKWIVQCIHCQQYGRRPETPSTVLNVKFEENVPLMSFDENGVCDVCRAAMNLRADNMNH